MKKKNQTPLQALKRLYIVSLIVGGMIAFMLIAKIMKTDDVSVPENRIETIMDHQLDSLLSETFDPGTIIESKGTREILTEDTEKDAQYRNDIMRYERAAATEGFNPKELEKLQKKAEKAKEKLSGKKTTAYYRNVIVILPDGRRKSFYQRTDKALKTSSVIMCVTIHEKENNKPR